MKRSAINGYIREAIAFFDTHQFRLPPFAYYSPGEWVRYAAEAQEVIDLGLGWDLTDHGTGDFARHGLLLFTIRNGRLNDARYRKSYAEKVLLVQPQQVTPMHFHFSKMEDIINRSGGVLVIQLYNSTVPGDLADTPVSVSVDGFVRTVPAGGSVRLRPGESICLPPRLYHSFWAEEATVLVGEVSMVNDDHNDNRYHGKVGRFPAIEEDEAPQYLLCTEYKRLGKPGGRRMKRVL